MYRFLLISCLFYLTAPLFSQRKNFAIGFQSGINSSKTVLTNEFDNSPLKSDFFIGSSFGVVARSKLFKYKWQWASLKEYVLVYGEYGINVAYGGYNYRFNDQVTFQEQLNYSIPLLLVFKTTASNYWYKKLNKKRTYFIVKTGFSLQTTTGKNLEKIYTFGEATLSESVNIDNKINPSFIGALGIQKEYRNGRIMYIGFSAHTPFGVRTKGEIILDSPQINEIVGLAKQGNFYSIDLQYFIGKSRSAEDRRKRRKRKNDKLPKIIYNPRYY